jgi:phenylalanyl-tRNA synthetase beta chain
VEAVTYSFLPSRNAELFGGGKDELRLINPISADLDVMRPSILPNLIAAAGRNSNIGSTDLAIFEVGPQHLDATPEGQQIVAGAIRTGNTAPRDWTKSLRSVDLFDIKADGLFVLESLGAPTNNIQVDALGAPNWYHPGRSGAFRLGPNILGYFGDIHPKVLREMDVDGPIVGFEVFIEKIPAARSKGPSRPLLKLDTLQSVNRDFSFVVDQTISAERLIRAAQGAEKALISDVHLFDEYVGQGIPEGKKSLAIAVTLQPKRKTLTDEELEAISEKIINKIIKDTDGQLRG